MYVYILLYMYAHVIRLTDVRQFLWLALLILHGITRCECECVASLQDIAEGRPRRGFVRGFAPFSAVVLFVAFSPFSVVGRVSWLLSFSGFTLGLVFSWSWGFGVQFWNFW